MIVLRDPDDRNAYGDYRAVTGLRAYLLDGTDRNGRVSTFARLLWRTLQLARRQRQRQWSHPGYEALLSVRSSTDRLVVDGPNWAPEAAFGREWWVVAATGLLGVWMDVSSRSGTMRCRAARAFDLRRCGGSCGEFAAPPGSEQPRQT